MDIWLVAIGGFFGAIARYATGLYIGQRLRRVFPYGTFTINIVGSLLLGMITGFGSSDTIKLLLGTGFMGAFTTFSTFNWEALQLAMKQEWKLFFKYVVGSYMLGIFAAFLGFFIACTLKG